MNPRFSTIRPFIISTGVLGTIFVGSITQAACVTAGSEKTTSETQIQEAPAHVEEKVEKKIEVLVDGKDVRVMVDGKPVPAGQIRDIDGAIVVLGEHGEELERIELAGMGGQDNESATGRRMIVRRDGHPSKNSRGMLGVMMAENDRGVLIQNVLPETPAAQAGLREGDIIVEINGRPANVEALSKVVAGTRPGQSIKINGLRDGQHFDREIVLGRWDPEVMDAGQNRERESDREENREIHMEWNGNQDGELDMGAIESMLERLMMMIGQDGDDVEFDIRVEMDGDPEGREHRVEIHRGDMIFHADGENSEFSIQRDGMHGDVVRDRAGNMFFSGDEGHEGHEGHEGREGEEHAIEEMMRAGQHQIEAWMGEMSEEAGRWAQDAEHRMNDFAEMFDSRMGEMASAFEEELHRVMERQDHGHRETEMMFRERDLQLKEGGMMLQQKLGESGQKLKETLQRFADGYQKLAKQNRMLAERVERLEQAFRHMMEGGRDSDARNGDEQRRRMMEEAKRSERQNAEEMNQRADERMQRSTERGEEAEQRRRRASDRSQQRGAGRGKKPAEDSERDRD
ncbi:MAG: PDZ domain-containing protein [Phycisphaerales bacterium]|nr:PDZ domain-containing protein [Phycisphaerales bacterium]